MGNLFTKTSCLRFGDIAFTDRRKLKPITAKCFESTSSKCRKSFENFYQNHGLPATNFQDQNPMAIAFVIIQNYHKLHTEDLLGNFTFLKSLTNCSEKTARFENSFWCDWVEVMHQVKHNVINDSCGYSEYKSWGSCNFSAFYISDFRSFCNKNQLTALIIVSITVLVVLAIAVFILYRRFYASRIVFTEIIEVKKTGIWEAFVASTKRDTGQDGDLYVMTHH